MNQYEIAVLLGYLLYRHRCFSGFVDIVHREPAQSHHLLIFVIVFVFTVWQELTSRNSLIRVNCGKLVDLGKVSDIRQVGLRLAVRAFVARTRVRSHLPEHVLNRQASDFELATHVNEVACLINHLLEIVWHHSATLCNQTHTLRALCVCTFEHSLSG